MLALLFLLCNAVYDVDKARDLFFILQLVYIVVVILKRKHFLSDYSHFFCLLQRIIFLFEISKSVVCNHRLDADLSNIVLQVGVYLFLRNYRLRNLLSEIFHIDFARRQL